MFFILKHSLSKSLNNAVFSSRQKNVFMQLLNSLSCELHTLCTVTSAVGNTERTQSAVQYCKHVYFLFNQMHPFVLQRDFCVLT